MKKAFTLIELLVVISILAILGSIIVPSYLSYKRKCEEQKAVIIARQISETVKYSKNKNDGVYIKEDIKNSLNMLLSMEEKAEVVDETEKIIIEYVCDTKKYTILINKNNNEYIVKDLKGKNLYTSKL